MQFTQIRTELNDHIFSIIIDREAKMNALNAKLLQEIKVAVASTQKNLDVYGIIITGSGDKAFAAGADISEFASYSPIEALKLCKDGHEVMNSIEQSGKPIVAAVKGFALGGGCELAMACHFRVVGRSAKFGQPEVNLGVVPGYGGTQRLTNLIGRGRALEHLCTGSMINAEDAERWGLANYLVEDDEVLTKSKDLLNKIAQKSPKAISKIIECVNASEEDGIDGYQTEIEAFSSSFGTAEFLEGTQAFLEKRRANFRN